MSDVVGPAKRSEMMARIRGKDTKPELILRKGLHRRGFRFRIHDKKLPSKPDLVFPKFKAVLFVHGCFWHGHDCHLFKWPSTRREFWRTKIERNRTVDARSEAALRDAGWRVLIVWECTMKGPSRLNSQDLISKAVNWLRSDESVGELGCNQK